MITFERNPDPSLSTICPSENIIEVGTFSKTIATGIRVAWIMASKSIINNLNLMRFDNGGSSLMQRMVFSFVNSSHYPKHLASVNQIYKRKRNIVSDALTKYCSDHVEFHIPQGGFYHWVKIKNGLKNSKLAENALKQGVGINVGNIYFVNREDTEHVRIVYSKLKESDLVDAVKILSTCFKN
jgi:DNA-binding transcriptional MocR family regulator